MSDFISVMSSCFAGFLISCYHCPLSSSCFPNDFFVIGISIPEGSQCLWSSTEVDQVWVANKVVEQYAMWVKLWSVFFLYYLEFRSMTFLPDHVPQKFTCIAQLSDGMAHTHTLYNQHETWHVSITIYGAVKAPAFAQVSKFGLSQSPSTDCSFGPPENVILYPTKNI